MWERVALFGMTSQGFRELPSVPSSLFWLWGFKEFSPSCHHVITSTLWKVFACCVCNGSPVSKVWEMQSSVLSLWVKLCKTSPQHLRRCFVSLCFFAVAPNQIVLLNGLVLHEKEVCGQHGISRHHRSSCLQSWRHKGGRVRSENTDLHPDPIVIWF